MIKNYVIIAWRSLIRDKWYSLLNILGLAIGILFSMFLILYVIDELSYDRYNVNANRIFRVVTYASETGKPLMKWSSTQPPLAAELKKEFPEVGEAVRFFDNHRTIFRKGSANQYQEKVFFADSNVFKVFTWPFIEGDPSKALTEPNSVVLTQSVAERYFGRSTGIVGQNIQDVDGDNVKVTGIIRDIPTNSHFIFNVLVSQSTLPPSSNDVWAGFYIFTYVMLKPGADPDVFEKKLQGVVNRFVHLDNLKIAYKMQPITSIHLHSDMVYEPEEVGSISYVFILSAIAIVLLIIACINYMNLTTARSAKRAKEIGIRKVTGSTRATLIFQFLIESSLIAVISVLISLGLLLLLLPIFGQLSGKLFTIHDVLRPQVLLAFLSMTLSVGVAGGGYPAFYLSKFNPVHVLKGGLSKGSGNIVLRRVLITLQFSISMIMLICTITIYNQLRFLGNKDLGFSRDMIVALSAKQGNVFSKINTFKNELRKDPHVISVSSSSAVPGDDIGINGYSVPTGQGYVTNTIQNYRIDEDFIKTMGMHIAMGRDFSGVDTLHSIIVNEQLVKYFGWKAPIGQRIKIPGEPSLFYDVIGVVKDFNQKALYNPIVPMIFFYGPNNNGLQVKFGQGDIAAALARMEKAWKAIFPDLPFEYRFLDQQYNSQYAADERRGKIFVYFSVVSILINCLGLLGLIAYTTMQMQKEIGIRKVLGAGLREIVPPIIQNFIYLVGLACLIAFPLGWFFMNRWLGMFYYSTPLTATPFLLSAFTVLAITLLTVIFHTVKAALANPVLSLRVE